jgi:ornithine cyclodeaminase/alanine dehydrogenase-like protein (mu-crystallin family)
LRHCKKPGRQSGRERIFIRAIGLVNQDVAMADMIYRAAVGKGLGTRLPYDRSYAGHSGVRPE